MKKKRVPHYTAIIDGQLYGSIKVKGADGKPRQIRKLVDTPAEARQWALARILEIKIRRGDFTNMGDWIGKFFG